MSIALASTSTPTSTRQEPLRVMVVDDSVVIRGLISRWIAAEPDMVVAASLRTGLDAVNQVERIDPDVAVLDIEMPELDGISALPLLLAKKRNLIIIMASTLTRRNAEISFKALSLGASDYIPKPESTREPAAAETFHHDLIQKIRTLGAKVRRTAPARRSAAGARPGSGARAVGSTARAGCATCNCCCRPFSTQAPRVLLIGSSTGGPQALMTRGRRPRPGDRPFPGADHPAYAADLHDHSRRASGAQPAGGRRMKRSTARSSRPGTIYLAPGGRHMRVVRHGADAAIALDDGPPVNFCKPAVDPLFMSAIDVWQGGIMAVVLTGMGSDGMRGGKEIVAAGGSVIAQDEATSVVWGMPGAAANAGICAAVLPLNQIAPKLVRLFAGDRS